MEWYRFGRAVLEALFVAFLLGGPFSPPDPFTQLLYALPTFLVGVPFAYRFQPRIHRHGWTRHLVLFAGAFVAQVVWQNAVGEEWPLLHVLFVLAGAGVGAWMAYFGGIERVRASDSATTVALAIPLTYVLAAILTPDPTRLLVYATGLLVVTLPVTYHFVTGRET